MLIKDQKESIGRKALLGCLQQRNLESIVPLISDYDVPLVEPTSMLSKVCICDDMVCNFAKRNRN